MKRIRGTAKKEKLLSGIKGLLSSVTIMMVVVLSITTGAWAISIKDDGTGGDCTTIGTWDSSTKTCKLQQNVTGPIDILNNNITLDGAGYTLSGPGYGNGIVVPPWVQNVTIENLTLTGWGVIGSLDAAINISGSYPSSQGNHTIQNNTITGSARGIWLIYTNGNTLSGNTITSSYYNGIQGVFTTNNNAISGNVISSTTNGSGITIGGSGNVITGNTINSNSDRGMDLTGTDLTVTNNTVSSNRTFGIRLGGCSNNTVSNNTINYNGYDGIYLDNAGNNTLSDNTASHNGWGGITLWGNCHTNTLSKNTANENGFGGIRLFYGDSNNTISGNTVRMNGWGGIRLLSATGYPTTGNIIYHNNIIANGGSDSNPADNYWHNPTLLEGNYWSDYTGLDDGSGTGKHAIAGDGIGDTCIPYPAADFDYYPFINPSGWERPVSNAGPDQTVDEGTLVTLDGSRSTGQNLTFSWTQVAGPTVALSGANTATPSFTPWLTGGFDNQVFTFQLTVTSGSLSSSDTVDITVKNVNHAPVAEAGDAQTVNEGNPVMLDGSASYDPDSDPITHQWVQRGGTPVMLSGADTAKPTFTAPILSGGAGGSEVLIFELTVLDTALSSTDEVQVTVEQVNHAPIANAGTDQTKNEGSLVMLNGTGSYDPDGDPLTYAWSQVSGPLVELKNPQTPTPSFTAPAVGLGGAELLFQLVVNDPLTASDPDTVVVTVQNINDPPKCELAQASPDLLWPPNHKLIPVKIVGVTDPNNDQVTITITGVTQDEPVNGLGDGDTSPDAVLQGDSVLLRAERSGLGNGRVYRIYFTANDGQGGSCTSSVTVGVPLSMKKGVSTIDDGQLYDSTQP